MVRLLASHRHMPRRREGVRDEPFTKFDGITGGQVISQLKPASSGKLRSKYRERQCLVVTDPTV